MLEDYIRNRAFYDELNKIATGGKVTKTLSELLNAIARTTGKGVNITGKGLSGLGTTIQKYPKAALGAGTVTVIGGPTAYRKGKEKVQLEYYRQTGNPYY